MKVLSLFDGMACGALALQAAGVEIESYDAFEIDKYAIQTATHNFPFIKHHGDVFTADFTHFKGVDLVCGGSPCTYWSIAQKNNRETEASGMGWELFSQYCRAIKEAEPMFFIYENNKSMSKAIRASIDETFGFEAIMINSALVSAQNRQRLYWVGKRNSDGTYSKVDVKLPNDRGIVLRDILESGEDLTQNEKAYCLTASYDGAVPWNTIERGQRTMVAEPVGVGYRGRMEDGKWVKRYESNGVPKANAITTAQTDSMVAEPVNTTPDGKSQTLKAQYAKNNASNFCCYESTFGATGVAVPVPINTTADGDKARTLMAGYYKYGTATLITNKGFTGGTTAVAEPIVPFVEKKLDSAVEKFGYLPEMWNPYNNAEITDKTPTLTTGCGSQTNSATVLVTEPIRIGSIGSNAQAYKMLGNGWTVDVIAHLIKATQTDVKEDSPMNLFEIGGVM